MIEAAVSAPMISRSRTRRRSTTTVHSATIATITAAPLTYPNAAYTITATSETSSTDIGYRRRKASAAAPMTISR